MAAWHHVLTVLHRLHASAQISEAGMQDMSSQRPPRLGHDILLWSYSHPSVCIISTSALSHERACGYFTMLRSGPPACFVCKGQSEGRGENCRFKGSSTIRAAGTTHYDNNRLQIPLWRRISQPGCGLCSCIEPSDGLRRRTEHRRDHRVA